MILKISYAGRNILFTGDASGRLYTKLRGEIESNEDLKNNLLSDIDCLMLPHHGSNKSAEYTWFYAVKDSTKKEDHKYSLLTIISSNPDERDNLPWKDILDLNYERGIKVHLIELLRKPFRALFSS